MFRSIEIMKELLEKSFASKAEFEEALQKACSKLDATVAEATVHYGHRIREQQDLIDTLTGGKNGRKR